MKRISWFSLVLGLFLAACAGPPTSQSTSVSIEIKDAWSRPAVMMNMGDNSGGDMSGSNGAAYMTIVNEGADADRLTSAESNVANSVELHQTVMKDNVMSMSPVEAIEVPANGQVELKPGGYHVMLVGLKQDLKVGDIVKLTLVFEKAGRIDVEAEVKNP
jgi:copper(I)-binding protein